MMTAPAMNDKDDVRRSWSSAMLMVLAVVLSAHAALVLKFWWVTDDAYISFRYARNLALGEGLRFNVWEQPPVEGYSNFLWFVLAGGGEQALEE